MSVSKKLRRSSVAWMVGGARHKLADHWRRRARDERVMASAAGAGDPTALSDDPWDVHIEQVRASEVLCRLGYEDPAIKRPTIDWSSQQRKGIDELAFQDAWGQPIGVESGVK